MQGNPGNRDPYYYYDDDYYDEYYQDYQYPVVEDTTDKTEFDQSSILDNILEIILDKDDRKSVSRVRPSYRPRYKNRYQQAANWPQRRQPQAEEKFDQETTETDDNTGNILASVGFFTIVLPSILGGLLYLGVPVAQSLFAGASLITTFLLSGQNKSLITPASIDSVARIVLINILEFLHSVSQAREGRVVSGFPVCMNTTYLETRLAENGCKGDYLTSSLPPGAGILHNTTMCREGSLPSIVHRIGQALVQVVGECQE